MQVESIYVEDDGLDAPEVGAWAEAKYRLIALYDQLFSTGMKDKWDQRVYIDLYAAAGYNRIRGTSKFIMGSPLLALSVENPFDKYIFCEANQQLLNALKQRVARIAPHNDVAYVPGDCNARVDVICRHIPSAARTNTVLGLCFVDPFDLGIKFDTLRKLSSRYLDFLCLLAVYMDANRNYSRYVSGDSHKIDDFLGTTSWRERWKHAQMTGRQFPKFLAEEFSEQMKGIGYIPPPLYSMKEVRSDEKNLPLYYLALFSRSSRAYEFWAQVLKYGSDQLSMF